MKMIAAAHDVIHESSGDKSAEELSAEWLIDRMKIAGLSTDDQEIARLAIMGTTPMFDKTGAYMGQHFLLSSYPSEHAGEIALCVAAADMEAIFASHGPIFSHNLFKERIGVGHNETPTSLDGLIEFQVAQIKFVENHQPLCPELEQIFGGLRNEIVEHHTAMLNDLLVDNISTWDEVVKRDEQFCAKWSE